MRAGWMTGKSYDAETTMGLSILSYILLDTNASPVKKALTENELLLQCGKLVRFINA